MDSTYWHGHAWLAARRSVAGSSGEKNGKSGSGVQFTTFSVMSLCSPTRNPAATQSDFSMAGTPTRAAALLRDADPTSRSGSGYSPEYIDG
jgi:hypothetical protein